jgi:hypothetical protein
MKNKLGPPPEQLQLTAQERERQRWLFWGTVCAGMGVHSEVAACAQFWALIHKRR